MYIAIIVLIVTFGAIKKMLSTLYYKAVYYAMFVEKDETVLVRLFESRLVRWVLSPKNIYILKIKWAMDSKNIDGALNLWESFPKYLMWTKTHAVTGAMFFAFLCESQKKDLATQVCDQIVLNERNIRYLDPILLKEVRFLRAYYIEKCDHLDIYLKALEDEKTVTQLRPMKSYQALLIQYRSLKY